MKTPFLLLLLCVTCSRSQRSDCPAAEDIKPCVCSVDDYNYLSVSCEGLTSAAELQRAVSGMRGLKLSDFKLVNSSVGVLPGDIFSGLEIRLLSMTFTNLTRLSESQNRPTFIGLEDSLEILEIRNGFVNASTPLSKVSLSHLKKLYIVQLEGNVMPLVPNDWFEMGPYQLRDLYLLDTSTSEVGSHAFESLEKLKMFALTGGSITTLSRDIFCTPAIHLASIDLSKNRISSLPANFFYQMPSLQEVYLESNALTTISEVIFAPVWNLLTHVYYYGNPIDCSDGIKWIYKYRLPEILRGYCVSPENLRNRYLDQLTLQDFK